MTLTSARLASVLGLLVACGGAPPTPVVGLGPLPSAVAPPPTPGFDLSPVSAPANLMVLVHVGSPAKLAATLREWAGVAVPVGQLVDESFGDGVAPVIDLSQPVDIGVALDARGANGGMNVAFAAGVRSVDDVKSALGGQFVFSPIANGAWRIEAMKAPRPEDEDERPARVRSCVVAPAFGSAAARVVCAPKLWAVDQLWPYLVRGATRVRARSDVHLELRVEALRTIFGARTPFAPLTRGASSRDPFAPAVLQELNDFGMDVDQVAVEVNMDDAAGQATATLSLREARSPLSRLAVAHADRLGPPPATFLRLPVDSDAAFFSSGADLHELDRTKQMLVDAIGNRLETRDGLSAADAAAVKDVLGHTVDVASAPLVFAKGVDGAVATAALGARLGTKTPAGQRFVDAAAHAKLGGWDVLGVERPIAQVGGVTKEWALLLARPGIAKALKAGEPQRPPLGMKAAAVPKGLPAGSLHFVLSCGVVAWDASAQAPPVLGQAGKGGLVRPAPPQPFVVNTLHLYLVPDGGRTWMVWSLDDSLAIDKAIVFARTPAPSATLAARGGLEELRAARASSGGFFTVRGLVLDGPLVLLGSSPQDTLARSDPLRGLGGSSQGATPISAWLAAPSATTMTATVHVPRGVLRDAMSSGLRF